MAIFYIDGKYIDDKDASIPVMDLSILRGFGIFDFLRTYGGKPFHLDDHIERLRSSASITGINISLTNEEIKKIVETTLLKNDFSESNVRLIVTGGATLDGITPDDESRLLVMVTELKVLPKEWYGKGVKIITSKTERYLPDAKTTNYLPAIMILKKAKEMGAVESVYVNRNNNILEGTTSNLFFVIDGKIVTAKDEILEGITRKVILESYKGCPIETRVIDYSEIKKADEAFLSSSNREVLPVTVIDDVIISEKPGKITLDVMKFFREYTEKH